MNIERVMSTVKSEKKIYNKPREDDPIWLHTCMSSCKRGWGQALLIVTTVALVTRALWESAIILLTLFRYFHATI